MQQFDEIAQTTGELNYPATEPLEQLAATYGQHRYDGELQNLLAEHDQLQADYNLLERRYQELYDSFEDAVEQEAYKMVLKATRILQLPPEQRPAKKHDLVRTIELHMRQLEDQHTTQALQFMRQAQRKALELERQLALERAYLATEHERLLTLQTSERERTQQRIHSVMRRLRARSIVSFALLAVVFLLTLPLIQLFGMSVFHVQVTTPLFLALFIPSLLYIPLGAFAGRLRATTHLFLTGAPHKHTVKQRAGGIKV